MLTTVHRQAWDSAIIRQAHAVRETGQFEPDGTDFQVRQEVIERDILDADIVLCCRKETRAKINLVKRRMLGRTRATLRRGEPLVAVQSWRKLDIYSGQIWTVAHDCQINGKAPLFITDGVQTKTLFRMSVEDIWTWSDDKFSLPFRLGYAMTVAQAQGSEWPRVFLVNQRPFDRRWIYTAITRASKGIVVMQ
jgi:ATP-dependent exoDNAse (exonuclease V) alpha subunit